MTWIQIIILSIIEGITEFLPISSTGHMIIASSIMGIEENEFTKLFEVCVQLGAILAVVVLFWKKFFDRNRMKFYFKLIFAVFPVLILGFAFSKKIDKLLESPVTVACALLIGGIVLLFVDTLFKKPEVDNDHHLTYQKAFMIGLWQVLAMIPGTSRSAATIIGGMQQKLTRRFAAEFSFFLAVPTMMAATGYKLLQSYHHDQVTRTAADSIFNSQNMTYLLVGNIIAFVIAMIAIKTLIHYLQKHTLRAFGVYRIIAAGVIFLLMYQGIIKKETPKDAPAATVTVYKAHNTAQ